MIIDGALLLRATGCSNAAAQAYAPQLNEACAHFGIDGPERLPRFLAQISHESGSLFYSEEVWGPTPAQLRYEGREDLGNTQPGDGSLFRGRGLIQVTGRAGYEGLTAGLRKIFGADQVPDFTLHPTKVAEPRWAAWSAADYWDWRGLNALADAGQFDQITQRVNGGQTGAEDRRARWAKARLALRDVPQATTPAPKPAEPTGGEISPPGATPQDRSMPIPAVVGALLPSLIEAIPKLGGLFAGSKTAERNVAAAMVAMEIARDAVGAVNAQDAIEKIKADPAARVNGSKSSGLPGRAISRMSPAPWSRTARTTPSGAPPVSTTASCGWACARSTASSPSTARWSRWCWPPARCRRPALPPACASATRPAAWRCAAT